MTVVPSMEMASNISHTLRASLTLTPMSRRRGGDFFITQLLTFCVHTIYRSILMMTGKDSAARYWRAH